MNELLIKFAVTPTQEQNLFSSIGIDWKLLVLQTIAFLILLWFLKKFVYPPLVAMLDKSEAKAAEAAKAAEVARVEAAKSQSKNEALLKEAKKEAAAIVATAKQEASDLASSSDKKAKERAERIVDEARGQIEREVEGAKKQLHNEMVDLVAAATEKVTSNVVDAKANQQIIASSVKEVR